MTGYTFLNFLSFAQIYPTGCMPNPYVSSKCFISKIKYMFGGLDFFRLKVPQSPLQYINRDRPKIICFVLSNYH